MWRIGRIGCDIPTVSVQHDHPNQAVAPSNAGGWSGSWGHSRAKWSVETSSTSFPASRALKTGNLQGLQKADFPHQSGSLGFIWIAGTGWNKHLKPSNYQALAMTALTPQLSCWRQSNLLSQCDLSGETRNQGWRFGVSLPPDDKWCKQSLFSDKPLYPKAPRTCQTFIKSQNMLPRDVQSPWHQDTSSGHGSRLESIPTYETQLDTLLSSHVLDTRCRNKMHSHNHHPVGLISPLSGVQSVQGTIFQLPFIGETIYTYRRPALKKKTSLSLGSSSERRSPTGSK